MRMNAKRLVSISMGNISARKMIYKTSEKKMKDLTLG